jgi:RES domain-containing protein
METFFRLVQAKWADSAMTGHGARTAGGRWNPPGMPAVYLAESRALAALEVMVHAPCEVLHLEWRVFRVEVPDDLIETVDTKRLPADWRDLPSSTGARRFGEAWLMKSAAAALRVPSVIVPEESALVLNPLHRDFVRIRISKAVEFRFDPRIHAS